MFVSEVWNRIFKLFGILIIGVEIYLGICLMDVASTVTANSTYIKENPSQFVLDVTIDAKGVHKDGKSYQMASDSNLYWVSSNDKYAYDVKNFCAFQPYPKTYSYIWITGMIVSAILVCLIFRHKWAWIIEFIVILLVTGIALLVI